MKKVRLAAVLLGSVVSLAACVAVPEYSDPLSSINRSVSTPAHPLSTLKLGVIHSDNTKKSLDYLKESFDLLSSPFADPAGAQESDPARMTRAFDQILGNRFRQVQRINTLNDAKEMGVDVVMVLDMQIVSKHISFTDTKVDLSGIILKPDGTEMTRIEGHGLGTVPYPAFSIFGKVSNAALKQFQENLDGATVLTEFAKTVTPQVQQVASVTRPHPQAQQALQSQFPTKPVALNFPKGKEHPDDIAVIIGNANYGKLGRDIPDVTPAYADAEGIKAYVTQTLGVRPGNVIDLRDATSAGLVEVFGSASSYRGQLFDWVRPGISNVTIYYSGHGAPGSDGQAYLVPIDANAQRVELSGYPLNQLYRNLAKIPAKSIKVILEACFSGQSQAGNVITNASPVFLKTDKSNVPTNVSVISAGAANQIASWEQDKTHGLFTKYYLKGMSGEADSNKDGQVSSNELSTYLQNTMTYFARRYYGRDQKAELVNF